LEGKEGFVEALAVNIGSFAMETTRLLVPSCGSSGGWGQHLSYDIDNKQKVTRKENP
jgi:hypothetical protein